MKTTVLVADSDDRQRARFETIARDCGYRVVSATSADELGQRLSIDRPDVVVLDANFDSATGPDAGLAMLDRIKSELTWERIPVLISAGAEDSTVLSNAIEQGAADYLLRPYRDFEVRHRLRNVVRWQDEAARARQIATDVLDPTTPTGSPQELLISLEYEFMRGQRYERPISCVVVRVDNLAEVIDGLGDPKPALAMQQIDIGIRTCVRMIDHIFRTAATEFTVILPETDAPGAETVRSRITNGAENGLLWTLDPAPEIRVGFAAYPEDNVVSGNELHGLAKTRLV